MLLYKLSLVVLDTATGTDNKEYTGSESVLMWTAVQSPIVQVGNRSEHKTMKADLIKDNDTSVFVLANQICVDVNQQKRTMSTQAFKWQSSSS